MEDESLVGFFIAAPIVLAIVFFVGYRIGEVREQKHQTEAIQASGVCGLCQSVNQNSFGSGF